MFSFTRMKFNKKVAPSPSPEPTNDPSISDCSHVIVGKHIDISPDKGKTIYYCRKCLSTFIRKNNEYIIQYVNRGPPSPDIPE